MGWVSPSFHVAPREENVEAECLECPGCLLLPHFSDLLWSAHTAGGKDRWSCAPTHLGRRSRAREGPCCPLPTPQHPPAPGSSPPPTHQGEEWPGGQLDPLSGRTPACRRLGSRAQPSPATLRPSPLPAPPGPEPAVEERGPHPALW